MIMVCTFLNSHLLGAPCGYILHGLDPGLDWASFWPSTPSVFHVATPHSVSCCLSQTDQVSHLTPSLLAGWLLINVQVNKTTMLHNTHGHTYIHHIGITILLSFYTSSTFLGRLAGLDPCCLIQFLFSQLQSQESAVLWLELVSILTVTVPRECGTLTGVSCFYSPSCSPERVRYPDWS
jgi:hypothetical protein